MDVFDLEAVLSLNTTPFENGLSGAENSARSGASRFGDILRGNIVSSAVTAAFSELRSLINSNMDSAVARLDTLNTYGKTMEALGFSTDQAVNAQADLVDAIDGLPTTLDGIISWQQQFTTLSGDIEQATDITIALNNATLAAGRGQEEANAAMEMWYRMIAEDQPNMQRWMSVNARMPAQMNQLAQEILGVEAQSQDLYDAWSNGSVTTEQVTDAFIALNEQGINGVASFADQAQIGAQTIETAYGNIGTAIARNLANVINVINGDATEGGGRIVEILLTIKSVINQVGAAISAFVTAHEPEITAITEAINSLLQGGDVGENMSIIGENLGEIASDALTGILDALSESLPELIEGGTALLITFLETITEPENLGPMTDAAMKLVSALSSALVEVSPELSQAIVAILGNLIMTWEQEWPKMSMLSLKLLGDLFADLFGLIAGFFGDAEFTIFDAIDNITNGSFADFKAAADLFVEDVLGMWGDVVDFFLGGTTDAHDIFIDWKDDIVEIFTGLVDSAKEWATDMIDNFIDGLSEAGPNLTASAAGVAGLIANNLAFSEPEEGPLSNFHTYAPDMIDLFSEGIEQSLPTLGSALNDMGEYVYDNMPTMEYSNNGGGFGYEAGPRYIVVQNYIGDEKIDEVMIDSRQRTDYVSGGRG